jgi:hypothetical protein
MVDTRKNGGGEKRLEEIPATADAPEGSDLTSATAGSDDTVSPSAGAGEGNLPTPWSVLRQSLLESLRTGY